MHGLCSCLFTSFSLGLPSVMPFKLVVVIIVPILLRFAALVGLALLC